MNGWQRFIAASAPKLALAVGILFTTAMVSIAYDDLIDSESDLYRMEVEGIKDNLVRNLAVVDEVLNGMRVLFDASTEVEADEFQVLGEDVLKKHDFLRAALYMPLIRFGERDDFERGQRDNGVVGYAIRQLDGEKLVVAPARELYLPIHFIEPLTPLNARQMGLDVYSIAEFRPYILNAIETAASNAAPPTLLGRSEPDFLFLRAIYAGKSTPANKSLRRRLVNGLVGVRVDHKMLLAGSNPSPLTGVSLALRSSVDGVIRPLFEVLGDELTDGEPHWVFREMNTLRQIDIGDQTFLLNVRKELHYEDVELRSPLLALFAGLTVTLLLWSLARTARARAEDLQRVNDEIQALVVARTQELADEKEKAQTTLQSIADAVISTDRNGRIRYMNPVAEKLTGWDAGQALGRAISDVFGIRDENSGTLMENPVYTCLRKRESISGNLSAELTGRLARCIPIDVSAAPIHDRDGEITGVVLVFHDVGETRRLTKQMAYRAAHDPLTDLPNRTLLMQTLTHHVESARRHDHRFAVVFLDIDRFKLINDTLGHNTGDDLIRQASMRFLDNLRDDDLVSRLGGDEFVVLLSDVGADHTAHEIAEKLRKSLHEPFVLAGQEVFTSVSVGIATYPYGGSTPGELLKNADAAMYEAKARGRNRSVLYTSEMNRKGQRRLRLEADLRRALERDELELYYQPQVRLGPDRVVGAEALLRWNHPTRGLLSPVEFVPLAEETGLIVDIGRWVLREACRQIKAWQDSGLPRFTVAVNIAHRQFHGTQLTEEVRQALDESRLAPHYLELELTEGILAEDSEAASQRLDEIRAMGVSLSIDDFGTGYSSLAYLKRFPIQTLKIDRCFVTDISTDNNDAEICAAVIAMAHKLNLKVVAEGVVDTDQLRSLQSKSCDTYQGYYFSEPIAAGRFPAVLADIHRGDPRDAASRLTLI